MSMAAIIADLERHKRCFDFTQGTLASDVAEAFASAVYEYMDAQIDPGGSPWIDLSPAYALWKSKNFPGLPMAELTQLMKDPLQLRGVLNAIKDRLVQTYGLDEIAQLHAEWFSEGHSGQNRPPRPFYELNSLAMISIAAVFDARFQAVTG